MPKFPKKIPLPSREQRKKLQRLVKKCLHIGKPEEVKDPYYVSNTKYLRNCEWNAWEVQLCNLVAWTGALIVTAVVLRSLYLMYLKPEGT